MKESRALLALLFLAGCTDPLRDAPRVVPDAGTVVPVEVDAGSIPDFDYAKIAEAACGKGWAFVLKLRAGSQFSPKLFTSSCVQRHTEVGAVCAQTHREVAAISQCVNEAVMRAVADPCDRLGVPSRYQGKPSAGCQVVAPPSNESVPSANDFDGMSPDGATRRYFSGRELGGGWTVGPVTDDGSRVVVRVSIPNADAFRDDPIFQTRDLIRGIVCPGSAEPVWRALANKKLVVAVPLAGSDFEAECYR